MKKEKEQGKRTKRKKNKEIKTPQKQVILNKLIDRNIAMLTNNPIFHVINLHPDQVNDKGESYLERKKRNNKIILLGHKTFFSFWFSFILTCLLLIVRKMSSIHSPLQSPSDKLPQSQSRINLHTASAIRDDISTKLPS